MTEKRKYRLMIAAALMMYVFYIALKNFYSAAIIEATSYFGVSKKDASLATTFGFVSYAAAQLYFAKFIGRIKLLRYLCVSVPVACVLYSVSPFCGEIWQVWILFAVCGALLAGVFPACMVMISEYLPDDMVIGANKAMGAGFTVSFVLDYLFASVFIQFADWRIGFWVFSVLLIGSTIFFCRMMSVCPKRTDLPERKKDESGGQKGIRAKTVLFIVLTGLVGLLTNMAYYSFSNWIPNLLSDEFSLLPSLSVFITLIIPVAGMAGMILFLELCKKSHYWKIMLAASVSITAVLAVITPLYRVSAVLTFVLMMACVGVVRGISHICSWQVPVESREMMRPASAATLINVFSCIGAGLGPPVFGGLIDASGYPAFFIASALLFAVLSAVSLFGLYRKK